MEFVYGFISGSVFIAIIFTLVFLIIAKVGNKKTENPRTWLEPVWAESNKHASNKAHSLERIAEILERGK